MIANFGCSSTSTSAPTTPPATASVKQTTQQPTKQEMTIGVGRELVYGNTDSTYLHWSMNVWESLVSLDNNLQPQPLLAESWTQSDDKLSWTFKLRKGVKFQDGTPFDAAAVVTNVERLRKHPAVDALRSFGDLTKVEAVDGETVRFTHKTPAPSFPAMITMFQSAMFSPQVLDSEGNITKPVATGPYTLVEWKKGESAVFQASSTYYGSQPSIKKVTYRYIPDANTRVAALQAGEIDAIVDVGGVLPEQVAGLKNDPNIVISTQDVPTTHYMFFNCGKGPFQDVRLRQAASMALDRASLVKNAVSGFGKPGQSVITPMASAWSLAEVAPKYDTEAAKKLVADATGGAGAKAILLVSSGFTGRWPYKAMAEIVQSELGKVGITVELKTVDSAAWSKALKAGEYDFSLTPHTLLTGDPDYFFNSWMLSTGEMAKSRSTGYKNPEADKLILAAAAETNSTTRKSEYDQLQKIAAQDVSVTPLYHETSILAARKSVQNLKMDVQFRASVPSVTITDAK
jgi:peptide/nickel transport system substrate-binding protein